MANKMIVSIACGSPTMDLHIAEGIRTYGLKGQAVHLRLLLMTYDTFGVLRLEDM